MEYPMGAEDALEKIALGRMVHLLQNNEGYTKLFKPILIQMLEDADAECHDYTVRVDRGKEAVVKYNTVKAILDICTDGLENMKEAMEYCRKNDIPF